VAFLPPIGPSSRGAAQRGSVQGIYLRSVTGAGNAVAVAAEWQNLTGENLLLTSAVCLVAPGGALTFTRLQLDIDESSGNTDFPVVNWLAALIQVGGAGAQGVLNWSGLTVVPPGFFIKAQGRFSAGTSTNSVFLFLHAFAADLGAWLDPDE